MRTLKLTIAYDGTNYYGWQRQKNHVTVQQVLEESLAKLFAEPLNIAASGRTDTGVHAYGQVVSFSTSGKIPLENIVKAAKTVLPDAIAVLQAEQVEDNFHARYNAKAKQYLYRIIQTDLPNPFQVNYSWLIDKKLDVEKMQTAADLLIGTHDFSSFKASGSTPTQPVRTIYEAQWQSKGQELSFIIKGNGFLYHMVRNIVGTSVAVGLNQISVQDFADIFVAKNRKLAGKTAPAQGLYLAKVFYE